MSWFSRFQAAIDGVAGIGAGVIAARGGLKARIASVLTSPAGQRDERQIRWVASAGGEFVFSDQPPSLMIHRIDLQNEI